MSDHIVIELDSVGVCFQRGKQLFARKQFWPLQSISFAVHAGESLGVLGRNGAGKTTLLKVLSGVLKPDRGAIRYTDNLNVSLLSLASGFDRELTGRENIVIQGLLLGMSRQRIRELEEAIIDFSELGDIVDEPVKTYSSGMAARLGFSIIYQMDPDVLMIDEALGVGDIEFRKKSGDAIKAKIQSDKTVILVSHSGETIKNLCDRAIWIEDGCVRMMGPSAEVVDSYESANTGRRLRGK